MFNTTLSYVAARRSQPRAQARTRRQALARASKITVGDVLAGKVLVLSGVSTTPRALARARARSMMRETAP